MGKYFNGLKKGLEEAHSTEVQPADFNESKKITHINAQRDWDMWLLGYFITLNDGSIWFSERGPIDYWDWEIGDELRIELFNNQLERRLFLQNPGIGTFGNGDYEL